jgi:hypothetical protein
MQEGTETVELSVKNRLSKIEPGSLWFRILFPVVILLVSLLAIAPFFFSRQAQGQRISMLSTHDMTTHFALMEQFDKVLRSGVYYPRWLPDINNGHGIASMNYYPPGFYYLTSLFHTLFESWEKTVLAITFLSLAGSGLAFYFLSRQFHDRLASAIGAIFYILLPYHTLDLYWRGAMPEFIGFVLLPLIIYFAFKLGAVGGAQHYAGLALFYGLHLITHFPVSYLFTYGLALYALVWAARDRDWKIVLRIAAGMALGLSLSAIYWLPAALESRFTQETVSEIFPYYMSLITLTPGGNMFDDVVNFTFMAQALVIVIAFFALRVPLLKLLYSQNSGGLTTAQSQTRLWIVMAFVMTFMCTMFAFPIVMRIPKIQATVPAWRWLAIASVFATLLVSAAIHHLGKDFESKALRVWGYRLAIGLVIVLNIWITARYVIRGALTKPTFTAVTNFVESGFTPRGATLPDKLPEMGLLEATPEGGEFEVIRWEPQNREVRINLSQPCYLRLKTYNFPGWTARLDGQGANLLTDHNGLQLIQLPSGIHRLEIFFVNTPPRTFGTILFGLSLFIIAGLIVVWRWQAYSRARAAAIDPLAAETLIHSQATAAEPSIPTGGSGMWNQAKIRRLAMPGLAGLAVIVVLLLVIRPFQSNNRGAATGDPISANRLEVAGLNSIMVAKDETALNELMDTLPKGDPNLLENLVQTGKIIRVANGTQVRILESGTAKIKVRILEGEQAMKEGWVLERWVK